MGVFGYSENMNDTKPICCRSEVINALPESPLKSDKIYLNSRKGMEEYSAVKNFDDLLRWL